MKEKQINEFLDYIRKEFLKPLWEELKPWLKEVVEEKASQLKQLVGDLLKSKNIKYESLDVLTTSDIIKLIRLNKVNGSDGVAAFKQTKEEKTFIYCAYCKGSDLISINKNCYIVIDAQKLNKDVEELFAESDLIILN